MRGVPARWGEPGRGIPTLLDTVWAEEYHEPGPLPPFEPGPPLPAGTPLLHLFGKGKGQGVPAREGVPGRLGIPVDIMGPPLDMLSLFDVLCSRALS